MSVLRVRNVFAVRTVCHQHRYLLTGLRSVDIDSHEAGLESLDRYIYVLLEYVGKTVLINEADVPGLVWHVGDFMTRNV